jgi:hypothetical protein
MGLVSERFLGQAQWTRDGLLGELERARARTQPPAWDIAVWWTDEAGDFALSLSERSRSTGR